MKKIQFLFLLGIMFKAVVSNAQIKTCGAAEIHQQMLLTDPDYAKKNQEFENMLQTKTYSIQRTAGTVYKIPVVVHVMHKGEPLGSGTNISDESIRNSMKLLNEMYRKVPGTQGNGNGVDVELEFSLAVRDPNGNCTNGITRVNMSSNAAYVSNGINRSATAGISDATLKTFAGWDRTRYYNIWLVSEIDNNEGGAGIQGYAYFASSHGQSYDGAVILSSNFTSGSSTTAAHEIGHALNLYHTFEGDGTGTTCPSTSNGCGSGLGDCCGDIPAHKRSSSDCVSGTNDCDNTTSKDLFIRNYMDYSSDACQNMFTADQKTRMVTALTITRKSFLPENGNVSLVPVSLPTVDFSSSNSLLCAAGQSIKFMDNSSCVPNSYIPQSLFSGISHVWTITNGINTYTSTTQNPVITFTNLGTYSVTLQVTNSLGTASSSKAGMFIIASTPSTACTPTSQNNGNYGQTIYNVKFNTINNSTSSITNVAYTDFACTYNTLVTAGQTYNLSISARAASNPEAFEVYINYNNDGDFADAGELIFSTTTASNTAQSYTTNVTIPATATQNTPLRMRVIGDAGSISATERTCGVPFWVGDVEDYGLYIKPMSCSAPTISSTSSVAICNSGTTSLSATTNTGTINWYSVSSGGTSIGTGTLFTTPTLTSNTTYYVDATNNACTTPTRTPVQVIVNTSPIVTFSPANLAFCSGVTSNLSASGATSYTWNTGATTASISLTPNTPTVYSLTASKNGCFTTKTASITINNLPTITASASSSAICLGNPVTLTASGASTYTWSNGITNGTPFTPSLATTYSVTGTDGNGCKKSTTKTVNVNNLPTITVNASSSAVCLGNAVTLTASGASTYTWSNGITNGTPFTPSVATTYSVTGTDANGCKNSTTKTVNVNNLPTITASASSSAVCLGNPVILNASGASTYTWSNGVTNATPFTPSVAATYSVTGTDANGCKNSTTKTVNVNNLPSVTLASIANPLCINSPSVSLNGSPLGGIYVGTGIIGSNFDPSVSGAGTFTLSYNYSDNNNCSAIANQTVVVNLCTSIEQLATDAISIYPNPVSDNLKITAPTALITHAIVQLYDGLGKLIMQEQINHENTFINMKDYSDGVYLVKIISNKKQFIHKIIKQQ